MICPQSAFQNKSHIILAAFGSGNIHFWTRTLFGTMISQRSLPCSTATKTCQKTFRCDFRCAPTQARRPFLAVRASTDTASVVTADAPSEAIALTDKAVDHIKKLRQESGSGNLLLRVGVKQGGCSGMSYVMDFEKEENLKDDDYTIQYEGFKLACDPKSLLYVFGMGLDYSDALIGGGFQFHNPNAQDSCGCGKSFGV